MSTNERALSLHISALSPEEFDHYTTLLRELAGPGQDDQDGFWDRPVPVLEARGYLRGRYQFEVATVDKILHYFPTTSNGKADVLSAGQFFAVMRLVQHLLAGKEPVKSLVFIQPTLKSESSAKSPPVRKASLGTSTIPRQSPRKPTPPPINPNRPRGPSDSRPPPVPSLTDDALLAATSGSATPIPATPPTRPSLGHPSLTTPSNTTNNPFRRVPSGLNPPPSGQLLAPSEFSVSPQSPLNFDPAISGANNDEPLPAPPLHPLSRSALNVAASAFAAGGGITNATRSDADDSDEEREASSLRLHPNASVNASVIPPASKSPLSRQGTLSRGVPTTHAGTNGHGNTSTSPNPFTSSAAPMLSRHASLSSHRQTQSVSVTSGVPPAVPPRPSPAPSIIAGGTKPPALPPRSITVGNFSELGGVPPGQTPSLPPRPPPKPNAFASSSVSKTTLVSPFLPPPMSNLITSTAQASLNSSGAASTNANGGPLSAGALMTPFATSNIMKESLRAAKGAQAQKANESMLEKTVNWEVIKSSSAKDKERDRRERERSADANRERQSSPPRPPRRAAPIPPPLPNMTTGESLEAISQARLKKLSSSTAPASISSGSGTSASSASRAAAGAGGLDAGRGASVYMMASSSDGVTGAGVGTPNNRLGRSKSLHQQGSPSGSPFAGGMDYSQFEQLQQEQTPTPTPAPPMPPPRRRPESFQPMSGVNGYPGLSLAGSGSPSLPGGVVGSPSVLSRRASIQSSITSASQPRSLGGDRDRDSPPNDRESSSGTGRPSFAAGSVQHLNHFYSSVKKRAEDLHAQAQAHQPILKENVRRIAERAEGKIVPGGYAKSRSRSGHGHSSGRGEKKGLFDDYDPEGDEEEEYNGEGHDLDGNGSRNGDRNGGGFFDAGEEDIIQRKGGVDDGGFGTDRDDGSGLGVDNPAGDRDWGEWDRTVRRNNGGGGGVSGGNGAFPSRGVRARVTSLGVDDGDFGSPVSGDGYQRL